MSKPSEVPGRECDRDDRDSSGVARDAAGDARDQLAAERDVAGDERDEVLDLRDRAGARRDGSGGERDGTGGERDRAAAARDRAAEQRDRDAEDFEARHPPGSIPSQRSALARREAASDREESMHDRAAGAAERLVAASDRSASSADRLASARQRTTAEVDRRTAALDRADATVDSLTGVSVRSAGWLALDREIARSRRAGQRLLVAFIDVDHLKVVNDQHGHAAGDALLTRVADALRTNLRAYDLVFRYGGDEFTCVLPGAAETFGRSLMARVNRDLAQGQPPASVTAGFAELRSEESSKELVARADADLYQRRSERPTTSPARG
jgi:diguanylate cyclase (GGDEF)-like protein